mgnify:CR=1 FL=1
MAYHALEDEVRKAETSRRAKYQDMRQTHGENFSSMFASTARTYDKFRSNSQMRNG